jgi:hypothetical protein
VRVARQRRPSGKRPASTKKAARSERAAAEAVKVTDRSPAEINAGFTPQSLDRSVIALPLLRRLVDERTSGRVTK